MGAGGWITKVRTQTVFQKLNAATVFADFGVTEVDPVLTAVRAALPSGAWIAGGYLSAMLSGLQIGDMDLWFSTRAVYTSTLAAIRTLLQSPAMASYAWQERNWREAQSFESSTHTPLSLMGYVEWTGPEQCIDAFDFTVATIALDGNDLWVGPTTLEDLRLKRLSFHRPQNTVFSRAKKYLSKGYVPDETCWLQMQGLAGPLVDAVRVTRNHLDFKAGEAATASVARPDPNSIPEVP